MGRIKSNSQRAAACRRWAKGMQITAWAFWVTAAVFLALGVGAGVATEWSSGVITVISAVSIAVNGFIVYMSSRSLADTATSWERLAERTAV